ncbi:uncharacterized protein METZ01_LOCUS92236 [marine metagenome]|uniref:Uncharacterized protein n=1 Tax=marine metagenome TaxID=408172 RepID=A0A381VGJ1_9ZZZZ
MVQTELFVLEQGNLQIPASFSLAFLG